MRAKGSTRTSPRTARILVPPIPPIAPPYFVLRCILQLIYPAKLFQFHPKTWNFSRRRPPPKLSDSPSPIFARQIRKLRAWRPVLQLCNPVRQARENPAAQEAICAHTISRRPE